MDTQTIRSKFLDFFKKEGHEVVDSSPLVPFNDPTLLFTNAGMVQFKDVMTGLEQRSYTRAVSSQRCLRAGGKHNDLDNVGYTARHHTFFEMLGNFSFGDYFKKEAIAWAWEFLTEVLHIPHDKLLVTVYREDQEAYDIWHQHIGLPQQRIIKISTSDNFWSMGETGPCGPCSEIFYDHGPDIEGGPPGSKDEDKDRYIEIWNLVFMQYDRDATGQMTPLPKPCVDTGMGLERIAAVMQHVNNNYDIDLFQQLIQASMKITGNKDCQQRSHRVISDHIRACGFLIADGVVPGNEGRSYVLRRIIRRAIRHGQTLGAKDVFFYRMHPALQQVMGEAYPILKSKNDWIQKVLKEEEVRFLKTLSSGMKLLEQDLATLQSSVIPGETLFKLYDTYGFPVDLTADIARERQLQLDMPGFERCMQAQRQRAKAASQFKASPQGLPVFEGDSQFLGYTQNDTQAQVIGLVVDDQAVEVMSQHQQGWVVLNQSPFYAESGGQVGDVGTIASASGWVFEVKDTQRQHGAIYHFGFVQKGQVALSEKVVANYDRDVRALTRAHHSATHLLHAALREILGDHVVQKGSWVGATRLRFDYATQDKPSAKNIQAIENRVNAMIRRNVEVVTLEMTMEQAKDKGALMLFGEKYADRVRVLSMGDFSVELCGGTHVDRTGDIGYFKIITESAIASGIRRIEAVASSVACQWVQRQQQQLKDIAQGLKSPVADVGEKLEELLSHNKSLNKKIEAMEKQLSGAKSDQLLSHMVKVKGIDVLAQEVEVADVKSLRQLLDQLREQAKNRVIVLARVADNQVNVIAGVSDDLTDHIKASELIKHLAPLIGGKGGGKAHIAQAGGQGAHDIGQVMASVASWVEHNEA